MLECKLEDFDKYRGDLLKYAKSLLKTRGFSKKDGELEEYSKDIVQQVYIQFHKWGTDKYVNEHHLRSFLCSITHREYLQLIDETRKGGQYLLFKHPESNEWFKNELRQLDVRRVVKCTSDEFDVIESFKKDLTNDEVTILDYLVEGYSQRDIVKKTNYKINVVWKLVQKIREKYLKYENKNK